MATLSTSSSSSADIPLRISSANASSERRVNPLWTISLLKSRLEPITGIPAGAQKLRLLAPGRGVAMDSTGGENAISLQAEDEESVALSAFPLQPYAEIHVMDNRPPGMQANYTDVSEVEKYTMPTAEYESRTDSVLAWKKAKKLGRFDPNAPGIEEQKVKALEREVEERGIAPTRRTRLLPASDARRGTIAFVGPVEGLPGAPGAPWVGVALDEPVGKNDGCCAGQRYFECAPRHGVFVRPERVEVGEFPPLGVGDDDEDMEEM